MADEATPDQQPADPAPVVDPTQAAPEADAAPQPAEEQSPTPAAEPGPSQAQSAAPVTVDNRTRRDDNDALEGHFAKVVDGEHAGQIGVFSKVLEYDKQSGYPSLVLVDFRDANYDHASARLPYDALRPAAPYLGGR